MGVESRLQHIANEERSAVFFVFSDWATVMSARYDSWLPSRRGFMRLINQFGDELAIGDTVVHSATDHVGKIKAVFRPTAQNPKGALGILWSGNSDIEEVSPADIGAAFK